MDNMPDWLYFVLTFPLYFFWMTAFSRLFYNRAKIGYIFFWSILGELLSLLFTTLGEIVFGLTLALYLTHKHHNSDMFWVFLMMECNLIVINIGSIIIEIGQTWRPSVTIFIFILVRIIIIVCLAALTLWLFFKQTNWIQNFYQSVNYSSNIWKASIIYTGLVCLALYLFEFIFTINNFSPSTEIFIFGVFIFSIIINTTSIIIILKAYKNQFELKWLKESEKARQEYYDNFDIQQAHTRQIIHDYKNILATIQLSLNDSEQDNSTMTKNLISEAQNVLTQQQPDQDSMSAIACPPLKNLLYLKWTAAQNKGINMIIQTEGEQILATITDVLPIIRIMGILLDNALEAAIDDHLKELLVLIYTDDQKNVEITVINQVSNSFRLEQLNQNGYTTKGDGHGQGMTIINELITEHHNLHLRKRLNNMNLEISLYIEANDNA